MALVIECGCQTKVIRIDDEGLACHNRSLSTALKSLVRAYERVLSSPPLESGIIVGYWIRVWSFLAFAILAKRGT